MSLITELSWKHLWLLLGPWLLYTDSSDDDSCAPVMCPRLLVAVHCQRPWLLSGTVIHLMTPLAALHTANAPGCCAR